MPPYLLNLNIKQIITLFTDIWKRGQDTKEQFLFQTTKPPQSFTIINLFFHFHFRFLHISKRLYTKTNTKTNIQLFSNPTLQSQYSLPIIKSHYKLPASDLMITTHLHEHT